jgi:hypothetical protein
MEGVSPILAQRAGADGRAESNEGKIAFDYAKDKSHIKSSDVYWQLNDARW